MTITTDDDIERQDMAFSLLRSQRVDGILLVMTSGRDSVRQVQRVIKSGTPLVCLDRIPSGITVDSVCSDSFAAAQAAVDHLIAMGHRRIAVLTGRLTLQNEQQMLRGYKRSIEKAGIPYERELVWVGSFNEAQGTQVCLDRLATVPPPTALFCTNGIMGIAALRAFQLCSIACPQQIALLTFDEIALDGIFHPGMTTVVQPAYDIGYRGANALLQRIQAGSRKTERVALRLPTELRIRESSMSSGPKTGNA